MKIKCDVCGYETLVNKSRIKSLIGGGMIFSGALGWVTYAFAGLLGFYGGAALIAVALLGGGSLVLMGKDLNLVASVGKKIADIFNRKNYPCPKCNKTDWVFSGFKNTDVVAGAEHKLELSSALKDVKKDLYIASGFLSSNVVNESFIQNLESALSRDVNVRLIFSSVKSHSDWMKPDYQKALESLTLLSEKYPRLELIQKHTHQKGIVVDHRYAITGSFNFLSNEKVTREETSFKVYEAEAIEKFRQEILTK